MDPEYPEERQAYMLEDSGVQLLLSQSHLKLPLAQGVQRIDLDQADAWLENHAGNNPAIELNGENLAYVIYTSGSTGKPKGAGNQRCLMSKQRRTFSAEFKREAAALVLDHGYSHIDACRSLGVVDSALRRWVKQLQQERDGVTPKSKALTPEQQKIQELEARINRLERETAAAEAGKININPRAY